MTLIAQYTVPGTEATIAITQTAPDMFQVVYDAPEHLGGNGSFLGEPTEQKARETANFWWKNVVDLRNKNQAAAVADQRVPGLPGVTYGQVAATFSDTGAEPRTTASVRIGRYATVRQLRDEARAVLAALVPDHATFRVAVQLDPADKLRFFQIDTPLKGRWVGCLFLKEQASDETYKVRDIAREEVVLRLVIADAHGALTRYGLELGSCGMCGRTLTDEESRARGIGPVCFDKL